MCRKHGADRNSFQPGQGGQGRFSGEVLFVFDLEHKLACISMERDTDLREEATYTKFWRPEN